MTQIRNTYTIGQNQQLIDINKNFVNFETQFNLSSKDGEPFQVLFTTKSALDRGEQPPFKIVKDTLSGNIVQDKGEEDTYFMVLKADTKCKVDVEINTKELIIPEKNDYVVDNQERVFVPAEEHKDKIDWRLISSIIVICIILVGLYYIYSKKSDKLPKFDKSISSNSFDISSGYSDSTGSNYSDSSGISMSSMSSF